VANRIVVAAGCLQAQCGVDQRIRTRHTRILNAQKTLLIHYAKEIVSFLLHATTYLQERYCQLFFNDVSKR